MSPSVHRYGTWPSPITSELVVRAAAAPGSVAVDGDALWWSESRPEEGGRTALVRATRGHGGTDALPPSANARTSVHEYGGGAWFVRDGVAFYSEHADARLHRLDPAGPPVALTPEPPAPRALRYADGRLSPDGRTILTVREAHPPGGGEPVNEIVRLDARRPGEPEVVVTGPDFVAAPRWRPDGAAFCWLEWDHPDMPWDSTRLVVDEAGRRTVVAGGPGESVIQPRWDGDGALWFASDRSGFYGLYRWRPGGDAELVVEAEGDIGEPMWVFGQSSYAVLDGGRVVFVVWRDGLAHLGVREPDGRVVEPPSPYTSIEQVQPSGPDAVVAVVASPTAEPHVVELSFGPDGATSAAVVRPPRDLGLDPTWFSAPEPVRFATGDGAQAHALYYRPTNPDAQGPEGDRPPLVVMIHGGPTAAARPFLRLSTQFWTSRGFAVADVNYRGSTGFGRAYRDLLRGQWGIADVEDCVAVARHLAEQREVDGRRCVIRGGSAGGFTTLAALAFDDTFAAGAVQYGVADLEALARDTHKFEARYLDGLVGPYPEARATYVERSPVHHVDRIDRPLVVFQGLDDRVVPPSQSEAIVDAVRAKGVGVRYFAFEGEGHGFRRAETIRTALDEELAFYVDVLGLA